MWMAYVQEVEIRDLKSGVENLHQTFSNLEFDAAHEAIYGLGRIYSPKFCNKLADRYLEAVKICDDYLEGEISIDYLVHGLIELNLSRFLYRIKNYLQDPKLINDIINAEDETETEESDAEDDNGGNTNENC